MFNLAANWIGVVIAAVASMIIGMTRYNPKIFGKVWASYTGSTCKRAWQRMRSLQA